MRPLVLLLLLASAAGCAPMRKMTPFNDPLRADEHLQLARAYEASGDLSAAEREYRAAAKGDKKNVDAFVGWGNTAFALGHAREAELALVRAHRLSRSNAVVKNNLAMLWASQGKRLKMAERLALEAGDDARFQPYALDTLAQVFLQQKRPAEARAAVEEARRLAPPDDPQFLPNLEKTALAVEAAGPP